MGYKVFLLGPWRLNSVGYTLFLLRCLNLIGFEIIRPFFLPKKSLMSYKKPTRPIEKNRRVRHAMENMRQRSPCTMFSW